VTEKLLTLFVEEFHQMVAAFDKTHRFPALEQLFSRGRAHSIQAQSANHLRFKFFGIEPEGLLPIAALTHVSDRTTDPDNDYYWLRTDPVTLWADMAQVFMTSHGFADLDPYERNEIENCIRSVLMEEGVEMHSDHPERWCIALNTPLSFEFKTLDDALGMDMVDALPQHPEAIYWRRILNEIQVALHHCPVNIKRRQSGKQEVNSVWFWGGGFIPEAAPRDLIDTVYSNHPVTRGLAIINDCKVKSQNTAGEGRFNGDGRSILVDWVPVTAYAEEELEQLEGLTKQLLKLADEKELVLNTVPGNGAGRLYNHRSRRRFWKRRVPLTHPEAVRA
jgi:hypothetical protein